MQTVFAFIFAIGLLVAMHEWGHFYVARLCGVKVIRFSIGFGPVLWSFVSKRAGTEFALSAVPLGGYVKMLDGREGPIEPSEAHLAFNNQTLLRRAAIVVAGPSANLLLAVCLYACVNWQVVPQPAPFLPVPVVNSLADKAGWSGGEQVLAAGFTSEDLKPIQTFEDLRWWLIKAGFERRPLLMRVLEPIHKGGRESVRSLSLDAGGGSAADATYFQRVGWTAPYSKPLIGDIAPGGRAASAGLSRGDMVLSVGEVEVEDAAQLRAMVRQSPEALMIWRILRQGETLQLMVRPKTETQSGEAVGRIGAYIGEQPSMVNVQFGLIDGLAKAIQKTFDIARMSLFAFGQMITGQVSLRTLNGPLAIADYAGKSAAMGAIPFINFLALISISLGVFNLLPLPVLDGGHLMYYLWEWVAGRPVPEKWWNILQRLGIALLLVMMAIAFYNDVLQILG